MQAVKGQLSNGMFIPNGEVEIPNNAEVLLIFAENFTTPSNSADILQKPKRQLGFLKDTLPSLPESFFDPLPEEDLQGWEM